MRKPQGYDDAQAYTGDYETLPPGGYVCRIKSAKEDVTRTGIPMLVIAFDIDRGEKAGYYQRLFDSRRARYPDAKWRGVYRQQMEGRGLEFFKGMITSIENSNPGFVFDWDETKLVGKLFGGLFGREEYYDESAGQNRMATKCMSIRSVAAIEAGVSPPPDKYIGGAAGAGFTPVQDDKDELPF